MSSGAEVTAPAAPSSPAGGALDEFLRPGPTVQSQDPWVKALTDRVAGGAASDRERAVALYYAVRDDIRYDPYSSELTIEGLSARRTLEIGRGWCVSKAILLAACCRAAGVPARLGFADVRNHLSTAKMRERMQTDVFYWHGYTSIHLDGSWLKATPAFNVELCDRFGLAALEFDGTEDSIYHPFDLAGNRHMEYLRYRGEFAEPPIEDILATFRAEYPHWREDYLGSSEGDFEAEVRAEIR
ncbi:MAG: transglutaminase family protein [Thermoanaerobaculia bacterium]|nr:transglutaminase family protein [Thermoanaerobaculia bacterium]